MSVKIRKAVFETNSSSSHSIHIDRETKLMDTTLLPDENGNVIIQGDSFGWEWERYNDAITKSNYASCYNSGVSHEILAEAIKNQTGARDVLFNLNEDSYIDHQSTNTLAECNITTVEELQNWIFNPNCWLITGNDNSTEPIEIKDFPTTDEHGKVQPYNYTHTISIDGIPATIRCDGTPDFDRFIEIIDSLCENFGFNRDGKAIFDSRYSFIKNENFYYFSHYYFPDNFNVLNIEEKVFYVYSDSLVNFDTKAILEKAKLKNIILETKINKKAKNDEYKLEYEIRENLLKNNFENYIKKIDFNFEEIEK